MDSRDESEERASSRRLKVSRLIDEYELHGIGEEMEQRWTAESDDRMSLRDLAEYFNLALLETTLREAGEQPIDGEAKNLYRLLTADSVSEGERTRARRRLARIGVDVERLQTDFVTYQAVRAYLKQRGAEYTVTTDSVQTTASDLQRLRGRAVSVTENKLDSLSRSGEITIGEFSALVGISVICEDCGRQFEVEDLLERGGCDCQSAR